MIQENYLRHIKVNLTNCSKEILSNHSLFTLYLYEMTKELNIGKIKNSFFLPNSDGLTFIINLKKSKLSIKTKDSNQDVEIDFFTNLYNETAFVGFNYIKKILKATKCEITESLNPNLSICEFTPNLNLYRNDSSLTPPYNISILGSNGGVSKSFLSILNIAIKDPDDPIYNFIKDVNLHLVDLNQNLISYYNNKFPNLKDKINLYEFDANDATNLENHLKNTKTSIVIDLSYSDTISTLKCCNSLGVRYINTALESTSVDENEDIQGFQSQERYEIFQSHRDEFKNTTAIICSGMNPGVVQWMAIELMKRKNHLPNGCYIIEEDTSFLEDKSKVNKDTIYTTWYPEGFLDEAIDSYPTFMKNHESIFLYNEIYELEFKVSLGNKIFYGCLMPHEEAITLGKMYNMETGFIYKINDHTTKIIKNNIDTIDELWNKPTEVLNPEKDSLIGDDLVGVLLSYDDFEIYMYNSLNNKKTYEKYKTNATYIQVASGVYGALCVLTLDNIPKGIYFIDELLSSTKNNYGEYIKHHIGDIIIGENKFSDGTLLDRMRHN
ncbi:S-adenosylmethionine decarboxylase [Clostridium sp. B9]|uniref:S-adenosylmethionine decarboxylase n=1 Tax=Clostridium sp. B9 TaxID=3423224 RepID=UPI003D2F1ACA